MKLLTPLTYSFFFALTAAVSVHGAIYFRREGVLPGSARLPQNNDPHADAFSTVPHGGEYGPLGAEVDNDKEDHSDSEYHPGLHTQGSRYDMNIPTSYGGASEVSAASGNGTGGNYLGPDDVDAGNGVYGHSYGGSEVSAMSGYGVETNDYAPHLQPVQPGERLQFPVGNYH